MWARKKDSGIATDKSGAIAVALEAGSKAGEK